MSGRGRFSAHDARRRHDVLLADDIRDVAGGDAQARHLARVEPDSHAVIASAELLHLADALHARQRVENLQGREVAQEQIIVAGISRLDGDENQRLRLTLGDGNALPQHVRRQLPLRDGDLILHIDCGDVLGGADLESDVERIRPVIGTARVHVNHVRHAVHLHLDRRCHRLLDGRGIRAGKGR